MIFHDAAHDGQTESGAALLGGEIRQKKFFFEFGGHAMPGVSDNDAAKIIQGRPYSDKSQLVSKKVVSEPTYEKIKDHVVARQSKS